MLHVVEPAPECFLQTLALAVMGVAAQVRYVSVAAGGLRFEVVLRGPTLVAGLGPRGSMVVAKLAHKEKDEIGAGRFESTRVLMLLESIHKQDYDCIADCS